MSLRSFFVYVPKDSPLHRLHPMPKFFILITINLLAWIIEAPVPLLSILILALMSFRIARIPLRKMAKFLVVVVLITQGIMASYLLGSTIPGEVIYYRLPWGAYASEMTLLYAFTMVLRFVVMLVGSTLILATIKDRDVIYALASTRLPYAFSFVVNLAFRTMSIFFEDFFKVRDAMILRGTDFSGGSPVAKAKKYVHIGVPLAVLAVRRMIEMTYTIEAKGFTLAARRTYYHEYKFRKTDVFLSALLVTLVVVAIVAKWWLGLLTFPGLPFS